MYSMGTGRSIEEIIETAGLPDRPLIHWCALKLCTEIIYASSDNRAALLWLLEVGTCLAHPRVTKTKRKDDPSVSDPKLLWKHF